MNSFLLADDSRPIVPKDKRILIEGCADFVRKSFLGYATNTLIPKEALGAFENWGMRAVITSMTDPRKTKTRTRVLASERLLKVHQDVEDFL